MTKTLKTMLAATAVSAFIAGPASANPCAADLKAVDAALLSAKLDPASLKRVQDLRAASGKASDDNKPAECLKTIAEAKRLLGVK